MTAANNNCAHSRRMISIDDALSAILRDCAPVTMAHTVPLSAAGGRILADTLASSIDVPGFDNSSVDGYALNTKDLVLARTSGLPISQRILAGGESAHLTPGCCARIFTGAPIPEGADAVAMQEICRADQGRIFLDQDVKAGANIRLRGSNITAGTDVLESGTLLRAEHLAHASSAGINHIRVRHKLRVAIVSTGDELVEPGQTLKPGQIYDSNRPLLRQLLIEQGCRVIDYKSSRDNLKQTVDTLIHATEQADLIISSGGVSVGERDLVRDAVEMIGQINLWRIRVKPGMPFVYGRTCNIPFIGLPGNPASAFVTFLLLAQPLIHLLQGRSSITPCLFPVRSGFSYQTQDRCEYMRAQVNPVGDDVTAHIYPNQDSAVFSSVAWAGGLVRITENTVVQPGDKVHFLPFSGYLR